MNENGRVLKFQEIEKEDPSITKRVILFLFSILLLIAGVKWLISFCLELLSVDNG